MRPVSRSSARSRRHRSNSREGEGVWPPQSLAGRWPEVIDFYAFLALFAACALGGGSSFAEVPSLLYVRPVAIGCLILFALTPARIDWRTYRAPMLLLGLYAVLMLLQLVPLPPALWTALPGRTPFAAVASTAGLAQTWRPISLTPDLTANSLAALVVPAAALVGFAKLRHDQRDAAVIMLAALCFVSALLGIGQFAGGEGSSLYLYQRTYLGFPVGLLSNRNHQAALLSLLFPALRVWTLMPTANRAWQRNRQWLALALGVFTVPVVLATGSRAGISLMLLGVFAAFLLFPPPSTDGARPRGRTLLMRIALPVVALLVVLATYLLGRAAAIERLLSLSAEDDFRFQFAPIVLRIVREYFPIGAGFGGFDPIFRQFEPDSILINSYFNHAHNELLELAIMAGLPGLLLLAALLIWWGTATIAAFRGGNRREGPLRVARLGSCVVAFLLLASLVDYPLRAPLMAAVFAIGCGWLCAPRADDRPIA